MAYINWTENLSVSVSSVDEQHKKWIGLINDFYEGIAQNQNKETILKLLIGMKNYTFTHFSHEERLMKQANYPDFEKHKKNHDEFVKKVNDFHERYASGKLLLSLEITGTIKAWITEHIMKTDKLYSSYMSKAGIK